MGVLKPIFGRLSRARRQLSKKYASYKAIWGAKKYKRAFSISSSILKGPSQSFTYSGPLHGKPGEHKAKFTVFKRGIKYTGKEREKTFLFVRISNKRNLLFYKIQAAEVSFWVPIAAISGGRLIDPPHNRYLNELYLDIRRVVERLDSEKSIEFMDLKRDKETAYKVVHLLVMK